MPNEPAEDRSVRGNTIKPAKVEPEQPIEDQYLAPADLSLKRGKKTLNMNANSSTLEPLPNTGEEVYSVTAIADEKNTTSGFGDAENTDIEFFIKRAFGDVYVDVTNRDGSSHTVVLRWLYVDTS